MSEWDRAKGNEEEQDVCDAVMQKYGDIIDLHHYQSKDRPHMSMRERAAQFAPFAALTGHEAAVRSTAAERARHETDPKREMIVEDGEVIQVKEIFEFDKIEDSML